MGDWVTTAALVLRLSKGCWWRSRYAYDEVVWLWDESGRRTLCIYRTTVERHWLVIAIHTLADEGDAMFVELSAEIVAFRIAWWYIGVVCVWLLRWVVRQTRTCCCDAVGVLAVVHVVAGRSQMGFFALLSTPFTSRALQPVLGRLGAIPCACIQTIRCLTDRENTADSGRVN